MIYVLSGNDRDKKILGRDALLRGFGDMEAVFMSDADFDQERFSNFLAGGDLFSKKYVVVLDSLIASDFGDIVLDRISAMANSENVFIITETSILKAPSDALKKFTREFQIFDAPKGREEKFNIFSITDAFGARDKKSVWVLMQKAVRSGIAAEEILNILIWQTKNLLFVKGSSTPADTGLSPFVYNKSKSYSKNYELTELENISREFVKMFHESHLGLELAPNLEKYLLKSI